jgi:hypothetical protein
MRTLNAQEKRTIRIAGTILGIFLVLLGGQRFWKLIGGQRAAYQQEIKEIQAIRDELKPYAAKIEVVTNLMQRFKMDPAKLSNASLVADASAAIQKAATTGGVQLGPIRETRARASSKELTTMQLEGSGPVTAIVTFLHRLESVGYPLIVDSVQLNPEASKPGMVKVTLTITILDFEQWKKEEAPNV